MGTVSDWMLPGEAWIAPDPKRGSAASTVSSLAHSARVPAGRPRHDLGRIGAVAGEVTFQRQVALLSRHRAEQGLQPAVTEVLAEDW